MPEITMTTFVDFVLASGTRRLTEVKKAKVLYGGDYSPAVDFYKPIRDSVINATRQNLNSQKTLASLRSVLANVNTRKLNPYQECIAGYKKWRGRKDIVWDKAFTSEWSEWTQGRLVVRINPELGVSIDSMPYIVKLYFKLDKPSKFRLETMFHLLKQYDCKKHGQIGVGILDLRRGRLHIPTRDIPDIGQLLAGEAAAFQTMWNQV